jgi:hypothetical protein
LIVYSAAALIAADWLLTVNSTLWARVVPGCAVLLSLAIGLPLPVRLTVGPRYWWWMCRAHNVALCAAVLFLLLDLFAFAWFIVALNESGGFF